MCNRSNLLKAYIIELEIEYDTKYNMFFWYVLIILFVYYVYLVPTNLRCS